MRSEFIIKIKFSVNFCKMFFVLRPTYLVVTKKNKLLNFIEPGCLKNLAKLGAELKPLS